MPRTADPADLDEEVDQLRAGREQLGELVADDEQVRQWVAVAALGVIVDDAGEVAGGPGSSLSADDLAGQGGLHPLDEGQLGGEIVIRAETCGSSDSPAKVAPPLKSTRTRLSTSGPCWATSEHQGAEQL